MQHFLKFRRKTLQTLVLGLVVLTVYAYYRTTIDEIRPVVAARNSNRSLMLETFNPLTNSTAEVVSGLTQSSSRNSSLETLATNTNSHLTLNKSPSLVSVASTSIDSQSPLISTDMQINDKETILIQRSGKNDKILTTINKSTIQSTLDTTAHSDTVRAIYPFGHDVTASEDCPNNGRDMDLVITITSAPSHIEARTAIRQTWGHYGQRRDVAILFMVGVTKDKKIEKSLINEQLLYNDVVRGRYIDSYSNLTLKSISSLEWVSSYCNEVKFMLKTDDDMFINVPRLLLFVRKHAHDKNVIFGRLATKWKPLRNKKSKYYVSTSQYKPSVYPDFTTGPAYLLSRDVIKKLYLGTLEETYMKLEDVFTTGIVAHKLRIKRSHVNEFFNRRISYKPCDIQRGISIHMVKYSEQFDLWKKLLDGKSKCP